MPHSTPAKYRPNNLFYKLVMRFISGSISVSLYVISIKLIPLSLAILFFNTNPLWTSILAALFINERFTVKNLIVLVACVFGVLLIVKPNFLFNGD